MRGTGRPSRRRSCHRLSPPSRYVHRLSPPSRYVTVSCTPLARNCLRTLLFRVPRAAIIPPCLSRETFTICAQASREQTPRKASINLTKIPLHAGRSSTFWSSTSEEPKSSEHVVLVTVRPPAAPLPLSGLSRPAARTGWRALWPPDCRMLASLAQSGGELPFSTTPTAPQPPQRRASTACPVAATTGTTGTTAALASVGAAVRWRGAGGRRARCRHTGGGWQVRRRDSALGCGGRLMCRGQMLPTQAFTIT